MWASELKGGLSNERPIYIQDFDLGVTCVGNPCLPRVANPVPGRTRQWRRTAMMQSTLYDHSY